ncbi:suppressor of fused domain protein [Priestia megaterium]|uniref:suppressor of fused domain protein n=1 Tax=Priestia megaterium TaxID=1404 RepID=UPI0011BB50EF|nr:suppressor of fused domain protein [Priestia megaterium]QDZ80226.1 suppressor of fused domain protein [Priestia megaterium]
MINYGELYYDHYSKYLGEPIDREIYRNNEELPSIQILKYENVFGECFVFNTLGLSNYEEVLRGNMKISMVVDKAFNSTGYILANVLFYCLGNEIEIGRGTAVSGIESIEKSFYQKYDKNAVYFTEPFAFPKEYYELDTESTQQMGEVLLGFFISQAEYDFFITYGAEKFEELLEESDVDPFNVNRKSVI